MDAKRARDFSRDQRIGRFSHGRVAPAILAFAAQGAAVVLLLAVVQVAWHGTDTTLPVWLKLAIVSGSAAGFTAMLGLPRWWLAIQVALPPAVYIALIQDLPAWPYAVGFAILFLVFSNSAGDRVPLYLSNRTTWRAIGKFAETEGPVRFIDLGCGLGGTVTAIARVNRHPDSRFRGVETAPLPYAIAKVRCALSRDSRIDVRRLSLWDQPLGDWDIVYAFLSPAPMPRLLEKASAELKSDAVLISNSFTAAGWPDTEAIQLSDGRKTVLHVWRGPPKREQGSKDVGPKNSTK